MSDEELRHLERAARANPTDADAGWRLAAALERVGDRRGHLAVLGRLARLGDARAAQVLRDAVALRPSGPHRSAGRRCARLMAPWRVRSGTVATRSQAHAAAATEQVLFLLDDEALVAVDTAQLVERWGRPRLPSERRTSTGGPAAPFALRGEDVLLGAGSDLLLLEGSTGRELARAPQRGEIVELVAEHDRAVALVGANGGRLSLVVGLELGEPFGRERWKRIHRRPPPSPHDAQREALHGIVGDALLLGDPVQGLRLEDGAVDEGATELARRLHYHGELRRQSRRDEVRCDGWALRVAREEASQTILDASAVEVCAPDGRRVRVVLPPLRAAPRPDAPWQRSACSVAIADGLGYAVAVPTAPTGIGVVADVVNVVGVTLAPPRVWLDVDLQVDLHGEFHDVEGIALDGALLVVVTTPGTCTLFRLER